MARCPLGISLSRNFSAADMADILTRQKLATADRTDVHIREQPTDLMEMKMAASHVKLETAAGTFGAYHAVPANPNGGSIVVLQEIFGVNAAMRAAADWLAQSGYHAIVPDLFWRQKPGVELNPASEEERGKAFGLMQGLDQDGAVEDALVAANFLRALPGSNGKVGAIGYCLGGKLAYMIATKPGIDAAASYYGVAIQTDLGKFSELKCPLLLHIAEKDELCPPEAQQAIEAAAQGNALATVMRHADVGHAFARRNSPAYQSAAAESADAATLRLFGEKVARA